ncbi:MAG: site-specific integrase [Candidatus Bathyarchaeia archaeon]
MAWLKAQGGPSQPEELLSDHMKRLQKSDPRERTYWHLRAVEYARTLSSAVNAKICIAAIASFFAYNDLPLAKSKSARIEADETLGPPPMDLEAARAIVAHAPLRFRAPILILLQSGMRIGELLNQFSLSRGHMEEQMAQAKTIVRFKARGVDIKTAISWDSNPLICIPLVGGTPRGGRFSYFTFIGRDGVEVLRAYLKQYAPRPDPSAPIFPFSPSSIQRAMHKAAEEAGLMKKEGGGRRRYPFHPHALRALFFTEAIQAGVERDAAGFFLGHKGDINRIYDRSAALYPEYFVKEYRKVEPRLNVLS